VETTLAIGTVLGGAYRLTRVIGLGGMGGVYEAVHKGSGKRVAVKVMSRELAAHPEGLARFRREVKLTSELEHPHIVAVVDSGTSPSGEPYLVMEYLEGEDLDQLLARERRLPGTVAVAIVKQLASALAVAHAAGIVHRDLKPANVFLLRTPDAAVFVKVVDFGISKSLKSSTTKLTRARTLVVGTPEYMAPEQAAGKVHEIDHRIDQWSLACIAWQMLSGQQPFSNPDVNALLYQVMYQDPTPLGLGRSLDLGGLRGRARADQLTTGPDLVEPREQECDLAGQVFAGGWDRDHSGRRPRRWPGPPQPLEQLGERTHGVRDASVIISASP